jgi:hypothetical protein
VADPTNAKELLMSAPNTTKWIGTGLLGLPLYGVLTFWSSLDPQLDPNAHLEAWSRFVTTNHYVLTHIFGSILGLIFVIFGVFALGAYLAKSRAGRLGLVAMAITVLASALFLTIGGVSTFAAPEEGQAVLAGVEEFEKLPPIFANTAFTATFLLAVVLLFVGNLLLGVAVWRSGTLPKWAGSPLGGCGSVHVSPGPRVRDDNWRREHPANGARGRVADSDRRGVDGVERPAPTLRRGGGSSGPAEDAMTPPSVLPRMSLLRRSVNRPC